jgi:MATE family multidrug resistance protein
MGLVDNLLVGHVRADVATQMAGVALGSLYTWVVLAFGMGTLMALDPLVAQALGAGDRPAVTRSVQHGVVLALGLSLPAMLLLQFARPVLTALGQQPTAVPVAASYARWAVPGAPAFFLFVVLRQSLQAMHRLRPIVATVLLANLANAVLDWGFVYGRLGLPANGAVGCAMATSLCRWLMVGGLLLMAWPLVGPHLRPFDWHAAARRAPLARMLRLGLPNGLMVDLEIAAFGTLAIWMNRLGDAQLAGHQVALNLAALSFMVPLGISAAAAVRVGHAIGRGDPAGARLAARVALWAGGGVMTVAATLFALWPADLAGLYTHDPQIIALAAVLLPIAAVFQVFDGVQIVGNGVLRGSGDTRTPMLVYLLGYWAFGLPLAYWLGIVRGHGPAGMWWGLVAALGAVAAVFVLRVRMRLARPLARTSVDSAP